jgi:hypothetical protein
LLINLNKKYKTAFKKYTLLGNIEVLQVASSPLIKLSKSVKAENSDTNKNQDMAVPNLFSVLFYIAAFNLSIFVSWGIFALLFLMIQNKDPNMAERRMLSQRNSWNSQVLHRRLLWIPAAPPFSPLSIYTYIQIDSARLNTKLKLKKICNPVLIDSLFGRSELALSQK